MNGNGGGSRRTARLREQSQFAQLGQLQQLLQLLSQLMELLRGGQLGQLAGLLPQGLVSSLGGPLKKKKKKKKLIRPRVPALHTSAAPVGPVRAPHVGASNANATKPASYADALLHGVDGNKGGAAAAPKGKGKGQALSQSTGDGKGPTKGSGKGKPTSDWKQAWVLRENDWTAPVMSLDDLSRKLDAKSVDSISAVVHLRDDLEAEELSILVGGEEEGSSRAVNVTAVLLAPKGSLEEHAPPKREGLQTHFVAGKLANKLAPRLVQVWPVCGTSPPKLKKPKQVSPDKPTAPNTVVVRASTEAKFFDDSAWTKLHSKPAAALQHWLANEVPQEVSKKVFDMWGWGEQGDGAKSVITGLMRIEESVLLPLLTCSGRKAWFVEPLKWATPCSVQWVKQNKQESNKEYCARVSSMASTLGVARGLRSLGVRQPQSSNEVNKERFWKVAGVPREWGVEVVQQQLQLLGLSDVQERSRKTRGKCTDWWFRASTPHGVDFFELEVDKHTLVACVVDPSATRQRKVRPLHQNSRLTFPGSKEFPKLQPPASVPPPANEGAPAAATEHPDGAPGDPLRTQLDQDEDTNMPVDAEGGEAGGQKRTASQAQLSPQKPQPPAARPPHGLQIRPNAGAGNCLFEALGQGIDKASRAVRAAVVRHLETHSDRYQPWWDGKLPAKGEKPCADWKDYTKLLAKDGAWGSNLEVTAAAVHYDRPIAVFHAKGGAGPHVFNATGKNKPLALWFTGAHYELLEGSLPNHVLSSFYTTKGPLSGGRGGSLCSGSSGRTRCSGLPTPPVSKAAPKPALCAPQPTRSNPDRARSRTPRSVCSYSSRGTNFNALPSLPPPAGSASQRAPSVSSKCTRLSALPQTAKASGNTSVSHRPLPSSSARSDFDATSLLDLPRTLSPRPVSKAAQAHTPSAPDPTLADSLAPVPQAAKKGLCVRWPCPFCPFVAKGKFVSQKKASHLKAWHPEEDLASTSLNPKALPLANVAQLAPEDRHWKCPLCDLGFSREQAATHPSGVLRYARDKHRLQVHPRAKPERFSFRRSRGCKEANARARAACRNKGFANRFAQHRRHTPEEGKGTHEWTTLLWPKWTTQRPGRQDVLCKLCKRFAHSVKQLHKFKCKALQGSKRKRLFARLRKEARKAGGAALTEVQGLIEQLTPDRFDRDAAGPHTLGELKWPSWLAKARATNAYCIVCKRVASTYKAIADEPCDKAVLDSAGRQRFFTLVRNKAGKCPLRQKQAKALVKQLQP